MTKTENIWLQGTFSLVVESDTLKNMEILRSQPKDLLRDISKAHGEDNSSSMVKGVDN